MNHLYSSQKRILIADDHTVIAKGMKLLLKNDFQIINIYDCQDLNNIMGNLKKNKITHLILDVSFPGDSSINYIDEIKVTFPDLKILLFTMHPSHLFQNTLIKYPDILFCQKSETEIKLITILESFLSNKSSNSKSQIITPKKWKLSKKEELVTSMLIEGKSTGEIAKNLKLRSNTVSTYKKRIFEKTEAKNILELAKIFQ